MTADDDDGVLNREETILVRSYRELKDAAARAEQIWRAHKTLLESVREFSEKEERLVRLRGQEIGPAKREALAADIAAREAQERAAFMNWEQARADFAVAEERRLLAMEERAPEEVSFWTRRFHTSLAIAHGGAFLAIANKVFAPDTSSGQAQQLIGPLAAFSLGLLLAGVIPVANYREQAGLGKSLAWWSAWAFVIGLGLGFDGALKAANLSWPFLG